MRMLRRIMGVTLLDKKISEDIRRNLGVHKIQEIVREKRLRWYGHIMRMEENDPVKRAIDMELPGKRPVGRPRARWRD